MARFRLVRIDDNGEIVREYYKSPMFPGDERNLGFMNDHYDCLWKFNEELHLRDYELAEPNLEFHITYDDLEWEYFSDPIDDFYNL